VRGLLSRILELTGYAAALAADESRESQDRLANLAELLQAADDFASRVEQPGVAGFLDSVSLLSDVDQALDDAPVALMTLHAAKGLEFDCVFLAGMEEGLIPHARCVDHPPSLEEERRLCYVGMTRARSRLHLSWAQSRQVFGRRSLCEPSRFLGEIPRELVRTSGPPLLQPKPSLAAAARTVERPTVPTAGSAPYPPGTRVRHPLFGAGTVLRTEGSGDNLKLTVSFAGLGAKRLVARFAGLERL